MSVLLLLVGLCGVASAEDHRIIVGTGLPDAVNSKMFATLKQMAPDLFVEFIGSTGGQDNINAMLHHEADAGFAQADVIELSRRTEPMVAQKIFSLFGLNANYMYAFTLRDGVKDAKNWNPLAGKLKIDDLRQLRGRTVAAFASAQTTGRFANERLALGMKIINVENRNEGFRLLREGKVDAFLVNGGKFVTWIEKEVDGNVFSLVKTSSDDITRMGYPYFIGKINYKKFGALGATAIGVRNEFICWNYTGSRKQDLLKARRYVYDHIEEIKEMRGSHADWQGVDRDALDSHSLQRYCPGQ